MTGNFRAILVTAALALCAAGYTYAAPIQQRGGSDYVFYRVDENCTRYGVIPDYDIAKSTIDAQLAQMYANGQRRLRFVIFFGHGIKLHPHTIMDSTGGNLAPRYRQNLAALLAKIKGIGFNGFDISFGVQGENSVWQGHGEWPEWREDLYQEHWNLIKNLRPILVASGLPYHIDLYGEGIPTRTQPMRLHYLQRLWADYTRTYGRDDAVGFSIIPAIKPDRTAQMREIYGNNPPPVFDLHIYHDVDTLFPSAHERLVRLGYGNIPWFIGETYYNDGQNADEFVRAINDTGQKVLYLYQWATTKSRRCGTAVDMDAPLEFDQYIRRGF